MAKAKKVTGLHVRCEACGTLNIVDAETGEVTAFAANPGELPEPVDPSGDAGADDDRSGEDPAADVGDVPEPTSKTKWWWE